MAPALDPVALTDGQLRARFSRIVDHLDSFGDVRAESLGGASTQRMLQFNLTAPGDPLEREVEALYREYYRRTPDDEWAMAKYTYEYRDYVRSARLAYHVHDLGDHRLVAHAHCADETDPDDEEGIHLRATEYDLLEANAIFMRLYASDTAPDCGSLLPLDIKRA